MTEVSQKIIDNKLRDISKEIAQYKTIVNKMLAVKNATSLWGGLLFSLLTTFVSLPMIYLLAIDTSRACKPFLISIYQFVNSLYALVGLEQSSWFLKALFLLLAVYLLSLIFGCILKIIVPVFIGNEDVIEVSGDALDRAKQLKDQLKFAPEFDESTYPYSVVYGILTSVLFWGTSIFAAEFLDAIVPTFFFCAISSLFTWALVTGYLKIFIVMCDPHLYKESIVERLDSITKELEEDIKKQEELLAKQEKIRKIEEAQRLAEEKAEADRLQGISLYNEAIRSDPPDEAKLTEAAELGNPEAGLYIGRKLFFEMEADISAEVLTEREIESACETILNYLNRSRDNVEADFLRLATRAYFESNTASGWESYLEQLRKIKKSGNLPEEYMERCGQMIANTIRTINKMRENESNNMPAPKRDPVVKRRYCRFCNNGICNYRTSELHFIVKCNYLDDPQNCLTALLEKGLKYEFE